VSQGEGGGRPTKYKPSYCKVAKQLSRLGATDFEIAQFIGVADSTLRLWMVQHPKFSAAIKLGKAPSDKRTERSLFARANGYTYEAEEIFLVDKVIETPHPTDPKGLPTITRTKEVLRVPVIKHVAPDTGALAFWLKNRRKDLWRDRHDHELSGKNGKPIAIAATAEPELLGAYYERQARIRAERRANPRPHPPVDGDGQPPEEPLGSEGAGEG
jgi:hypothetical protein